MKRLILAAAPAAALVAAVALPVAGCGGAAQSSPPAVRAESAGRKLEKIVADNRRPIARLADAVRHADASDPATLVRVRATASLVSERVEQSEPDINRLIALPGAAGAQAAEVQRALDDVRELSYALSARRLRAARIQTLAEEADQSTGELAAQHTMPSVGVETLVDELRDAARRRRRAHTRTRVGSAVVPARVTADAPPTFNTGTSPGESVPAAYCRFETASDGVYCWTPNDGFTLRLDSSGARRIRSDESDNRGLTPGYTFLPLGSSRSNDGYTCTSRASGLTCTSPSGAGWVLPRYRGLPQLF